MRLDINKEDVFFPRPLSEIENVSQAIQSALSLDSLEDAIGFMCMWDEYRRTGTVTGESCYGFVVAELLKVHGIDINKIRLA